MPRKSTAIAAPAETPSSMFMVMVVQPCKTIGLLLPGDPIGFMPVYRTYDEAKLAWPERQILEVAHATHP